ncbi:ficolin-1-like [Mizuhopecten yessoensis]|uniref:ficolin-1-like n=1 Tax=Mizuhopecten yessoensis TaxID=6573 RepID=UPI000B45C590|nr:ficolin-1-like [Mizuhopecten yessoensis]
MSCSYVGVGSPSGVYRIKTLANKVINVFCDMDTAGGPWTVIQRRVDGGVDFYRNWTDYKNGFGDLNGEFWIGNDNLHHLTNTHRRLRVELELWDGTKGFAQYSMFHVSDEEHNYTLTVQGFSGNIHNSLYYNNDQSFSTPDRDNDGIGYLNCAEIFHGSWWYGEYYEVNLNGDYRVDYGSPDTESMFWYKFPHGRLRAPLKTSMMMIQ